MNQPGCWARPLSDARLTTVGSEYLAFLVDFSDALREVKQGGAVRRSIWNNGRWPGDKVAGLYMFLWNPGTPGMTPMLMCRYTHENLTRPFAGSQWDILADDWETVTVTESGNS